MNRTLPIWITLAGIALVVSLVIVASALAADDSPDGSPPLIEPLVNAPHADERWTIPLNAAYAPIWGADGCRFGLTLHHRYPYAWEPLRVVELDGRLDLRIDGDYPVKYHTWVRLGDADSGWISRMAYAETAGPNVRLPLDAWEYLHAPGGTLSYPLTVGLEVAIEGYEWGTCSDSLNPIQTAVWSSRPELTVSVPDGVPPHLVDARSLGQRLDARVASPSSISVRWEPAPALDYDSWEVEHTTDASDPTWTALGTLTSPQDSAAPLEWLYDPGRGSDHGHPPVPRTGLQPGQLRPVAGRRSQCSRRLRRVDLCERDGAGGAADADAGAHGNAGAHRDANSVHPHHPDDAHTGSVGVCDDTPGGTRNRGNGADGIGGGVARATG